MRCFIHLLWVFTLFGTLHSIALPKSEIITGKDLFTEKPLSLDIQNKKGFVVLFLSALCPCSDSHLEEIRQLSIEYNDFQFVGVHSNSDEDKKSTQQYFKKAKLAFPIIKDTGAKLANFYKASKTPHAFVVQNSNILYQGGVSSSRTFEKNNKLYLREALVDLAATGEVKNPMGRTLGCSITRGGKNDW